MPSVPTPLHLLAGGWDSDILFEDTIGLLLLQTFPYVCPEPVLGNSQNAHILSQRKLRNKEGPAVCFRTCALPSLHDSCAVCASTLTPAIPAKNATLF